MGSPRKLGDGISISIWTLEKSREGTRLIEDNLMTAKGLPSLWTWRRPAPFFRRDPDGAFSGDSGGPSSLQLALKPSFGETVSDDFLGLEVYAEP